MLLVNGSNSLHSSFWGCGLNGWYGRAGRRTRTAPSAKHFDPGAKVQARGTQCQGRSAQCLGNRPMRRSDRDVVPRTQSIEVLDQPSGRIGVGPLGPVFVVAHRRKGGTQALHAVGELRDLLVLHRAPSMPMSRFPHASGAPILQWPGLPCPDQTLTHPTSHHHVRSAINWSRLSR